MLRGLNEFDISYLKTHAALNIPKNPVAAVQIIHGMNEHKERYYKFMEFLGEKGFITLISDNIGHGKSLCPPHDLGYICDKSPDSLLIRTARRLSAINDLNYPELPHFMIGHSMGSLIARCCMQHENKLDGVILTGTPCYSRLAPFADLLTAELEKKLSPEYRSEIIRDWSEKFLNRNFEDIPHSWICSNPEVVMAFNNDSLCNFTYTLSGYQALIGLMKRAYSLEKTTNPDLPVHFISGKDDPCMLSEEKFFEAVKSLENAGYKNITHKLYLGMRHEVLNETDKIQVWEDIAEKLISWTGKKYKFNSLSEKIPIVNGILYPDGNFEQINTQKTKFEFSEDTIFSDIIINSEIICEDSGYKAICGEGSYGGDGFVMLEKLHTKELLWLASFDNSNPFIDIIYSGNNIIATNNLYKKYCFDISDIKNIKISII